jgi:hypothetical protein
LPNALKSKRARDDYKVSTSSTADIDEVSLLKC